MDTSDIEHPFKFKRMKSAMDVYGRSVVLLQEDGSPALETEHEVSVAVGTESGEPILEPSLVSPTETAESAIETVRETQEPASNLNSE
jgi:hypothetical protein